MNHNDKTQFDMFQRTDYCCSTYHLFPSWFLLEAGWGPQRYYSGETLLTPLGTNGWTNIFCWLKCWDDCMGLKLPLSLPNSFIPPVPLSTSCWSDSSLNLIHQPKRSFLNVLLHLREMIQLVFLLESKGEWDQNGHDPIFGGKTMDVTSFHCKMLKCAVIFYKELL